MYRIVNDRIAPRNIKWATVRQAGIRRWHTNKVIIIWSSHHLIKWRTKYSRHIYSRQPELAAAAARAAGTPAATAHDCACVYRVWIVCCVHLSSAASTFYNKLHIMQSKCEDKIRPSEQQQQQQRPQQRQQATAATQTKYATIFRRCMIWRCGCFHFSSASLFASSGILLRVAWGWLME